MNKRGATFGVWIEILLIVILVIGALGVISVDLEDSTGINSDLTLGLTTNDTEQNIRDLQSSMGTDLDTGTSSQSSLGLLQLTTLPKILWNMAGIVWEFVNGNFISNAIALLHLGAMGTMIAFTIKLIMWFSIAFLLLKLITRIIV